jgi:ABC-type Fe3+-hydroxamate transport system substrate-binding protein
LEKALSRLEELQKSPTSNRIINPDALTSLSSSSSPATQPGQASKIASLQQQLVTAGGYLKRLTEENTKLAEEVQASKEKDSVINSLTEKVKMLSEQLESVSQPPSTSVELGIVAFTPTESFSNLKMSLLSEIQSKRELEGDKSSLDAL